ncbi:MAG: hypothetical protein VKM17_01740 [Cyanobacteriota bacterium]|nr:hypothetical protein [Cyanobacteriota bacterium]
MAQTGFREFLPSANQGLAELEEATGKPVLILEEPELNVAATFRRARAGQASHVLRRKSSSDPNADDLITFEWRMALSEVPDQKAVKATPETAEA